MSTALPVLVRLLGFLAGLVAGFFGGLLWQTGHVERENGTTDLMPPVDDWSAWWWVLLASWFVALALALVVRRVRWLALGWLVGLPAVPLFGWLYAWQTFGTWGTVPLP